MEGNERVIYDGKVPIRAFLLSHNIFYFLFFWWLSLIPSIIKSKSRHIKITSQRIEFVRGIFSKDQQEIKYYRVIDSSYDQSFKERLFNVGQITITTEHENITFPIHDPKKHREKIRDSVRSQRKEMQTVNID